MANVKEAMNEWGREFLRRSSHEVADDADITFKDDIVSTGYCETCYYEEYVVYVSDGKVTETYWGSMTALISAMNNRYYD